jgi:fructose-bisphosphate aldolase, class II
MTLHGGSGTNVPDLEMAIEAGITVVHVNTDVRVAWRRGMEDALTKNPSEVVPYKLLPGALEAVRKVALDRLQVVSVRGKPLAQSV